MHLAASAPPYCSRCEWRWKGSGAGSPLRHRPRRVLPCGDLMSWGIVSRPQAPCKQNNPADQSLPTPGMLFGSTFWLFVWQPASKTIRSTPIPTVKHRIMCPSLGNPPRGAALCRRMVGGSRETAGRPCRHRAHTAPGGSRVPARSRRLLRRRRGPAGAFCLRAGRRRGRALTGRGTAAEKVLTGGRGRGKILQRLRACAAGFACARPDLSCAQLSDLSAGCAPITSSADLKRNY